MTFALGRAELILDTNAQPLLEKTTKAYAQVRKDSEAIAVTLAKANKAEVSDVRQAATIIIQERTKAANEARKIDQARLKDIQANTKVELKYYSDLYKEQAKLEQQAAKDREATTKAALKINQDTYKEEQKAAKELSDAKRKDLAEFAKIVQQNKEIEARLEADALAKKKRDLQDWLKFVEQTKKQEAAIEKSTLVQKQRNQDEYNRRERQARAQLAREYKADAERENQANAGKVGGFSTSGLGGTAATLLGFGAIASTAVIVRAAIVGVTDAVTEQEQAVRALTASYGPMAAAYKTTADTYAQENNRLSTDVERGVATFGILQKQYATTGDETKKLTQIALNLNAAYGGDLLQTFRDVSNAIQGEPQALEKYGIALQQNAIKNSDLLTASEKKLYESMSAVEQSRIRLRVLFAAAKDTEGAAAARAKDLAGAFDTLNINTNKLALTIGQKLKPELTGFVKSMAEAVGWTEKLVTRINEAEKARTELAKEGKLNAYETARVNAPFGIGNIFPDIGHISGSKDMINARIIENRAKEEQRIKSQAYEDTWKQTQLDIENKARTEIELQNTKLRKMGDQLIEASKRAADLRKRDLDEQKKAAEAERATKLYNLEEAHKAETAALQEQEYERKQASDAELARITAERDAKIDALDAAKSKEIQEIDVIKDAVKAASEETIRLLEIERDKKLKLNEQERDATLERLENENDAREKLRITEDRKIADSIKEADRKLDDAHKKQLRRIEEAKEKEQDKYADEIKAIDKKIDKEEKKHLAETRRIEDESKKKLEAIEAEIKGIEKTEQVRDNARKKRDLAERIEDARRDLRRAQGTGTPLEVAQARGKLTDAIRLRDPEAIRKAEAELVEITSRGAEAIEKAQRELRDAEEDLVEENREQNVDANKEILESRKDTVSKQIEVDKRAEDDRNRARRDELEKDKKAAKETTDDEIANIEKRQRKLNDKYEADQRGAKDLAETNKRTLEDSRRNEDEQYEAAKGSAKKRYDAEKDQIEETYNSEEKGLIPTIKRSTDTQLNLYDAQKQAVENRHKKEREEIDNTYNNPETGLIATHRKIEEAAQHQYSLTLAAAQVRYDAEKRIVQQFYDNDDGKSGVLNQLENLKTATDNALRDDIVEWEKWKDGLVGENGTITQTFSDAQKKLKEFIESVERRGGLDVTYRAPQRRQENPQGTNDGNPGDTQGSGGGGESSAPRTHTNVSGPAVSMPTPSESVNEVDVSPGAWPVEFGWKNKYTGTNYQAGAGWEADGNIAAWPNGPTRHKGIDLRAGVGTPVGSFTDGTVVDTQSGGAGGNMMVIAKGDKAFWYMHLDNFVASRGDQVKRGQLIAHSGETGTEGAPHLHFEVRTNYPPINSGARNIDELESGVNSIDPRPYINQHDDGYMFNNPTYTMDSITGALGQIAERGPEQLLGRVETARLNTNPISRTGRDSMDYARVGATLGGMSTASNLEEGDTMNYYGVAPESLITQWRDDQRRQRVLRGRR